MSTETMLGTHVAQMRFKEARRVRRMDVHARLLRTFVVTGLVITQPTYVVAQETSKLEDAKVRAYSKEFAERFRLPLPPQDMELSGALKGLEFNIERTRGGGYFQCVLKVYVDSSLPIQYPVDGRSGWRQLTSHGEHFMFTQSREHWLSLNVEDRRYLAAQDNYGRLAALASPDVDWPKVGYWAGLTYVGFYRDLVPGITYIKLDTPCGAFASGKGRATPRLLLERAGGKDYSRIVKPDPNDFLKLEMPAGFYEATVESALAANAETQKLIEQDVKRGRESGKK